MTERPLRIPGRAIQTLFGAALLGGLLLVTCVAGWAQDEPGTVPVMMLYPLAGAVFPPDIVAPTVRWQDPSEAGRWSIVVDPGDCGSKISKESEEPEWQPSPSAWARITSCEPGTEIVISVRGLDTADRDDASEMLSAGTVSISISEDPVEAPIFFREVPLPFSRAATQKWAIRWRLGEVSDPHGPRTVLENMNNCANCHSFSADGKTLAMDVDYGRDKDTYAIAEIEPVLELGEDTLITWRDFDPKDQEQTFGLLARISPGGRYVVCTVKDVSILRALPDLYASQLFFPVRGILAVYDRIENRFFALPGADDPAFVQTNPVWSPDGKWLIFARAPALDESLTQLPEQAAVKAEVGDEFVNGERTFRYDLYRLPFNGGRGGEATPLHGAHDNGLSNYFARYSPDGAWVVFCQARAFMFNQPDSRLFIMPSEGGAPRLLRGNAPGRMNSWHSWSPNGRWLVFSSKANGPYTQLWLTHIDEDGTNSPPVLLENFTPPERAANLPEFMNAPADGLRELRVGAGVRGSRSPAGGITPR